MNSYIAENAYFCIGYLNRNGGGRTIMSEKEMNSYRFSSGQEPTDEMLSQLMKEVAQEARESNQKAVDDFFASLCKEAKELSSKKQTIM